MHPTVLHVTDRIRTRSAQTRARYLHKIEAACANPTPARNRVSCTNLAHVAAAADDDAKVFLRSREGHPNIAIISSYNDMLSAHQPFQDFPGWIKQALAKKGANAQFAGGVPAMCDGVTQGQPGMELSLFSRDVIALSAAVALSHNVFDGMLMLGICDKIVPGLVIAALSFGHLPAVFVPGGPMPSGISNEEKAHIRKKYALGEASDADLLDSEMRAYHAPGTCTFYGTANSNQMMMEVMGLHIPGSAFVQPYTALRKQLTCAAAERAAANSAPAGNHRPVGAMLDERSFVNAAVALIATGGSSNHTLHIPAMARAAGFQLEWEDMDELSRIVPVIANIYPNGKPDINQFHRAGGSGFVIKELLEAGLIHADVQTVMGKGLEPYTRIPTLNDTGELIWTPCPALSADPDVLRTVEAPFQAEGGLRLVTGNLGRGIQKTSALPPHIKRVEAPAFVCDNQETFLEAFRRGELNRDVVVVVRFQGPRANGMPELHQLTPPLSALQDQGYRVALVTDGRMSGASGKVPAAIHLTPESTLAGPLARVQTGDQICFDIEQSRLDVLLPDAVLLSRKPMADPNQSNSGSGRELFQLFRNHVGSANDGGSIFHTL